MIKLKEYLEKNCKERNIEFIYLKVANYENYLYIYKKEKLYYLQIKKGLIHNTICLGLYVNDFIGIIEKGDGFNG